MNSRFSVLPRIIARSCRPAVRAGLRRHNLHLFLQTSSYSTDSPAEDMDHLLKNPYYGKYAGKMKQMQDSKPEEFEAKLCELEEQKLEEVRSVQEQCEEASKAAEACQSQPKKLNSVMKLELLQDKTPEEITEIWTDFHSKKPFVYAVIPDNEYKDMHNRLKDYPTFLYPLPRGRGYEMFIQQFSAHSCHFIPLLQYQAQKEDAPACLSLTHYTELMDDKGLVLMRGEPDTTVLSVYESQLLSLQLKMYYGMNSGLKFNLVRMFNNFPGKFRHMDVIVEFEKYKKDCKDFITGEL